MTVSEDQVLQRDADDKARVTLESGETVALPVGGPYQVGGANNIFVGDLWVLAGQSNMEGVADLVDTETPHPLVHSFQSREQWAVAEEPLHWLHESPRPIHHTIWGLPMPKLLASHDPRRLKRDPHRAKGAGLGLTFAKTLVEATGVPIGLIPSAHGGTSMQQWEPSRKSQGGGSLYGATLARVQAVGGKVAGILWYQGESDANAADAPRYEQRMTELVESFRIDFDQPDLPFYYVQIGAWVSEPTPNYVLGWNSVRETQRIWQNTLPNVGMVSAIDCGLDDGIHIDTAGLKTLGRRLAAVVLGQPAPDVQTVIYTPALPQIRVSFTHVQGSLTASCRPAGFSLRDKFGTEVALIYKVALEGNEAVLHLNEGPSSHGLQLWYGYGLSPYCNLADTGGAAIPAFGPIAVK